MVLRENVGLRKFWQDLEILKAFLTSVVFAWFVFTVLESRNFLPRSFRLAFLARISASRRVSDFTIHHPFSKVLQNSPNVYGNLNYIPSEQRRRNLNTEVSL